MTADKQMVGADLDVDIASLAIQRDQAVVDVDNAKSRLSQAIGALDYAKHLRESFLWPKKEDKTNG